MRMAIGRKSVARLVTYEANVPDATEADLEAFRALAFGSFRRWNL